MIVFFGRPGAGKTTQGQMLAKSKNWCWIAAGQLLRESKDPGIIKILKEGELVPSNVIIGLIGEAIAKNRDCANIVIDGFARNVEQADWLIHSTSVYDRSVEAVFVIDVPRDILISRLMERGRADDNLATIEARLHVYEQETYPVIKYFKENNIKVVQIDGSGDAEAVHQNILRELDRCKDV